MQNHQSTTSSLPDEILEQAAIWQMRLRECDPQSAAGRQLKAKLNSWLLANPLHQQAYTEMAVLWQALAAPVQQLSRPSIAVAALPTTEPTPEVILMKPQERQWPRLAAAACLVLSLLGGVGWQQQWLLQLQSDYRTAVGFQQQVQLSDRSQIQLNTDSAIMLEFSATERRVRLLKGEVWLDVVSDAARPFVVDTGQGTVTVTGTHFNVKRTAQQVMVSLVEGGVRLETKDKTSQTLQAGEQAILSPSGISAIQRFDQTAVSAWRRGQWVFYQTPLQQVVAELNRHRQGSIVIMDDQLNQQLVSGVFSTRDPDAALQLISQTLQLQQTRLTDYLVLLH